MCTEVNLARVKEFTLITMYYSIERLRDFDMISKSLSTTEIRREVSVGHLGEGTLSMQRIQWLCNSDCLLISTEQEELLLQLQKLI